jgi:hypothetical protein
MWRSFGVGMSEAIDLAKTEPEPPTAAKRKQSCYAPLCRTAGYLTTLSLYIILFSNIFLLYTIILFVLFCHIFL